LSFHGFKGTEIAQSDSKNLDKPQGFFGQRPKNLGEDV